MLYRLFGFESSKLRLDDIVYLMKQVNKCIADEAGGVMGATPEGLSHFVKCENDT